MAAFNTEDTISGTACRTGGREIVVGLFKAQSLSTHNLGAELTKSTYLQMQAGYITTTWRLYTPLARRQLPPNYLTRNCQPQLNLIGVEHIQTY